MKKYDREDTRNKFDEESTQVFKFGHEIISNSLNEIFYFTGA